MSSRGTILTLAIAGGIGMAVGYAMARHSIDRDRAAWSTEKAQLENQLAQAQGRTTTVKTITAPGSIVQVTNLASPEEVIERLMTMRASANDPRSTRRLVHEFENLIDA